MNKKRPVNLDLTKFHFPPMAIVSIMHRITGVLLFLFIPVLLALLCLSLSSPVGFDRTVQLLHHNWMRFLVWVLLCSALFHFIAGIRHLLMDMGCGDSLRGGYIGANLTFILALILFILAGVWLWA